MLDLQETQMVARTFEEASTDTIKHACQYFEDWLATLPDEDRDAAYAM